MTTEQRKMFADKLPDLANWIAGAMVFGKFVSGEEFSVPTFILGIILTIFFYYLAYRAARIP
jgi:hypothetical protein